jgi:hypothetical protein
MATKSNKTLRVTEVAQLSNRGRSTVYADISRGILASTLDAQGRIVVPATAARSYARQVTGSITR